MNTAVVDVSEWKAINLRLLDCTSSLLTHTRARSQLLMFGSEYIL